MDRSDCQTTRHVRDARGGVSFVGGFVRGALFARDRSITGAGVGNAVQLRLLAGWVP